MCHGCFLESEIYGNAHFMGHGYGRGRGSSMFGYDGDIDRRSFAQVSQRAMGELDRAKSLFLEHLSTVDVSKGPVTTEIIKFHLVPDMRKRFNKYVKEYGCIGTSRQITREEQDKINKSRKSLLWFTSVKVTPEAKLAYLSKINAHTSQPGAQSGGNNAVASTSSSSASASESTSISVGPLQDTLNKKATQKLNQAALNHAAANPAIKKSLKKKTA